MRLACPSRPAHLLAQRIFLLFALSTIVVPTAFAQIDRAVLEGAVIDPAGAAIVGANVKVQSVDTGIAQEQRTNSSGYYRFPGLAVGLYTVTVTNACFKTRVMKKCDYRLARP